MRYGRLVFVEAIGVVNGHMKWKLRCDCGTEKIARAAYVRALRVKSCGCLLSDWQKKTKYLRHGMVGTPTYNSWNAMLTRCNHDGHPAYKAAGIQICERWKTFTNFFADMGIRPDGTTLDRIDGTGNYEPSNCRWATPQEQSNNRKSNVVLSFQGKEKTISQWGVIIGISHATINARLHRGWTIEKALSTPV